MKKFEEATKDAPIEMEQTLENLRKLADFLKGSLVCFYDTGSFNGYYESKTRIGVLNENVEISKYQYFYSTRDLKEYVDNSLLNFSAGLRYSFKYRKYLEEAGYIVEERGDSGFSARNSYRILPNPGGQKKMVHILKEGDAIHKKKISNPKKMLEERIWYCGTEEMTVSDPQEIKKIMKFAEKKAAEHEEEKFLDFFKEQSGGESTAVIKTGGDEPIQYIPSRFKKLAEVKVANTADHRRNRLHTYEGVYLDTDATKEKKFVTIKVPDCYKGIVIGRGGKNIKALGRELKCFLKII